MNKRDVSARHWVRGCLASSVLILAGCTAPKTPDTATVAASPDAANKQTVSFEREVKPVLESKCLSCHSGSSAPWGFRLESKEFAFATGTSGPRIVPGKPGQSALLSLASTHKNIAVMPLVGNGLTKQESQMLHRWIAEGALWPEGRAGALKPSPGSMRPDQVKMREEWRAWFQN